MVAGTAPSVSVSPQLDGHLRNRSANRRTVAVVVRRQHDRGTACRQGLLEASSWDP